MAPRLYMTDLSGPSRAVLLAAAAIGLELERVQVDIIEKLDQFKPEFLQLNPQHTVPVLVDDDGTTVIDSHAIMCYLVSKYAADDSLYPRDIIQRADVDHKLHFDSGCLFALLIRIVLGLMTSSNKTVDDECKARANTIYDFLDKYLEGRNWVAGNQITIADFSLITSTVNLNSMVAVDQKFKNITNWWKRVETLPYYAEIMEKGVQDFKDLIAKLTSQT